MNRKIIISIIIFFLFILVGSRLWTLGLKNNNVTDNNIYSNNLIENYSSNIVDVSTQYITDNCLNEWNDYSKANLNNIESASNNMIDENTRYLIKNFDGVIYIYYLDDSNEEILYKKTDISTEYLSIEDLNNLDVGIEVIGSKNLNKLLEDFE